MLLNRIKTMLQIEGQDELLFEIIEIVSSKIKAYIKEEEVPKQFEWILVELAVQRFNRIGSEGMATESIDSKRIEYEDNFNDYKQYLDEYININTKNKGYKLL